MSSEPLPRVAIVDYGLGNLYSVKHACAYVGLSATITSSPAEIIAADAIILPGVGAYGDAMATLGSLGLIQVIRDCAAAGRPLVGICLGMQLLMSTSEEFGEREGLSIIPGRVVRFQDPFLGDRPLKVPQIGWNGIYRVPTPAQTGIDAWTGTFLESVADGEPMYFVHSYLVRPDDPGVVLSTTQYGNIEFCSSLRRQNVMACQFHPERSGREGLKIYRTFANMISDRRKEQSIESVA
jgi:imidazole glycerol-phosphate synthase subunit HisH